MIAAVPAHTRKGSQNKKRGAGIDVPNLVRIAAAVATRTVVDGSPAIFFIYPVI